MFKGNNKMGDDDNNNNNNRNGSSKQSEPPRGPPEHSVEIIHPVVPPPRRSWLEKIRNRLKEIFFPDDPLRQFKGQSPVRKLVLGAQYIFPILEWGSHYNFSLFKSDVVAGLTIASLAIPQVLLLISLFFLFISFLSRSGRTFSGFPTHYNVFIH